MSQEIVSICPNCGQTGMTVVGQSVIKGRLRWYRSTSCALCGRIEEDGEGLPPSNLRKQLLQFGGTWRLLIDPKHKIPASKILRDILGVSLTEIASVIRKFPEVFVGTKTEIEWLKMHMMNAGISATGESTLHASELPPLGPRG